MKKRLLSIFTAIIMVCSFVGVMPKFEFKVEAASYNSQAAIDYANKYALSYNPNYSNYNSIGGDCANFVSQCLYAGGFAMDSGWFWYSYNNRSNSWSYCPAMVTYFEKKGYNVIYNASASDIKPGNPVLYKKNGVWAHAAICVGYNSSGQPIINAHNNDRKQVHWQLGGSTYGWTEYCTIIMNGTIPDPVLPGTVDTSYATPWEGEPIATSGLITVYNNYATAYSTSVRNIAHDDWCTIHEVYTNGFCKVTYPTPNGDHTEYAKVSDFNIPKKDLPGKTNVYCDIGTEYYPTIFSWDKVSNATDYDLKIWKGTLWQGDSYTTIWSIKETSYGVNLPAGYYEAYIDSRNASGINMSNNVVKFTVGNATPVDLGTNFYAYITNSSSKKPLTNDGNNVSIRTKTGNSNQIWKFVRQSDKSYKIINCKDNNVLDVYCSGTTDGTNVQTWVSNDCNAQRWFVYEKSGTYYLRAKCGALVLDVNGGLSADGTNVQMWTSNSTSAQKFKIEKTNCPHSYGSWTTSKAATCAATGTKTRKCSICDKTETQTIAKKEHSYYTCHYEPTCIEKGYVEHICSNCGYSYNDSFVNANPNSHDYIQSSVNEIITYTCRDCNYSYTEKYSPINITADKVSGYPGETVTVNVYANLNGNKCYGFVIKNKFDSENFELVSIKSDYLSKYNEYFNDPDFPELNEKLEYGFMVNLSKGIANFTNDEAISLDPKKPIITYTFKVSENAKQGAYDMQLVSSLSDEYIEFVVEEVDTNYSEFSLVTFKIDPVFLNDAITVKCKHKYTSKVISATCKDKGYTQYTCSVCKHTYKDKYTDVTTEHKWGNWTTSKNATCTSDGSKTRKCSVCSKSEIQTITKLGHDYITEKVNASYKEDGYIKHTCKTCGDSFKDNFVKKPRGDMNNDGNVMIADVVMIQRCLTKTVKISTEQVIAADLNEDGKFNVFDLIIVKRMLLNS